MKLFGLLEFCDLLSLEDFGVIIRLSRFIGVMGLIGVFRMFCQFIFESLVCLRIIGFIKIIRDKLS